MVPFLKHVPSLKLTLKSLHIRWRRCVSSWHTKASRMWANLIAAEAVCSSSDRSSSDALCWDPDGMSTLLSSSRLDDDETSAVQTLFEAW